MTQYWILHFFCLLDVFPLNPGDFLFVFPANFCFSKQVICQIACLFRRGLALKLGRDCRLELFSDPLSQPLFTGNKVSGVDDTELKDMEFFFIVKWGRICKIKNQMGSKSSKGWFVLAFFLRMIVVFFLS